MAEAAVKLITVTPDELRALIREELERVGHRDDKPENDLEYLTTSEAAELAGCSSRTIRNWTKDGLAFKRLAVSGDMRIKRVDLVAFLEQHAVRPRVSPTRSAERLKKARS